MPQYTTGELAKACRVSVRTVQFYDAKDLLKPSALTEGGRRLYSDDDLDQLRLICMLKALGLALSSIKGILESPNQAKVLLLLLDEQARLIGQDMHKKQEQLDAIRIIQDSIRNADTLPVNSISDIEHIMNNRRKLRKTHHYHADRRPDTGRRGNLDDSFMDTQGALVAVCRRHAAGDTGCYTAGPHVLPQRGVYLRELRRAFQTDRLEIRLLQAHAQNTQADVSRMRNDRLLCGDRRGRYRTKQTINRISYNRISALPRLSVPLWSGRARCIVCRTGSRINKIKHIINNIHNYIDSMIIYMYNAHMGGLTMTYESTWLSDLDTEDINFIKKFILASGSLKEIAAAYQVSYPTVRLRLDRLIQKIQITERAEEDAFIGLVKRMAMDEKLELDTAKTIIRAYRDTKGED